MLRRSLAAAAAVSALCAATAPAASAHEASAAARGAPARAGTAAAKLPDGLYGKSDPKFDGVWRQSTALLALEAAGAKPAAKAVDWLVGQQCGDGSFTAYRAGTSKPCDAKKTPADTNATAVAVQALAAVGGHSGPVRDALAWLRSAQNKDGGWGYNPGGPTDANSTSVVIGAYAAAGRKAETVRKDGNSPYDALGSLQLGCDAKKPERGAFAYQPGKKGELAPNDDATAAAVLASSGSGLLVQPRGEDRPEPAADAPECGGGDEDQPLDRAEAGAAGAAYLTSVLKKNGGSLPAATPGAEGPDYGNTADTVVALAAAGHRAEARKALKWLDRELGGWDKARNDPAAVGGLMLAVHATGGDAAELGGTDLLKRLNSTGPAPARMPGQDEDEKDDGGSTVLTWSLIGAGLAGGAGIGFLLSGRRKGQGL